MCYRQTNHISHRQKKKFQQLFPSVTSRNLSCHSFSFPSSSTLWCSSSDELADRLLSLSLSLSLFLSVCVSLSLSLSLSLPVRTALGLRNATDARTILQRSHTHEGGAPVSRQQPSSCSAVWRWGLLRWVGCLAATLALKFRQDAPPLRPAKVPVQAAICPWSLSVPFPLSLLAPASSPAMTHLDHAPQQCGWLSAA